MLARLLAASFAASGLAEQAWCRNGIRVERFCCDRSCPVCSQSPCSGPCCVETFIRARGLCENKEDVSCIIPGPLEKVKAGPSHTGCRNPRWLPSYQLFIKLFAALYHMERLVLTNRIIVLVFHVLHDVMGHLSRCRPIGLLLILYHIRFGVHFFPDALVAHMLAEYSLCRAGSAEHCKDIISIVSGSAASGKHVVDVRRMPGIFNVSSPPPLRSELMSERTFLLLEDQIHKALRKDLRVVSTVDFPEASSLTCETSYPCNLTDSEEKFYSQHGEDGILKKLFQCVGVSSKHFIEIGTQSGRECNTRYLRVAAGFSGYMFDNQNEDSRINLVKAWVTPENAFELLNATMGPAALSTLDLLSIDTDGGDYGIWSTICGQVKPRVVVVEVVPPGLEPLESFQKLGSSCNYVMVYYLLPNMFFLRHDVWQRLSQCGAVEHSNDVNFFHQREELRWELYDSLPMQEQIQANLDGYRISTLRQLQLKGVEFEAAAQIPMDL